MTPDGNNRTEKGGNAVADAFLTAALALLASLGTAYLRGANFLHAETAHFLTHYLDIRLTLPEKIFDPLLNDWGCYQGRELSYLFDAADAGIFAWAAGNGYLIFTSAVSIAAAAATAGLTAFYFRRLYSGIPRFAAIALALSFIFCGCVNSFLLYRTAKPLTALCIVRFTGEFITACRNGFRLKRNIAAMAVSAMLAALLDRQGMFFCGGAAGTTGLLLAGAVIFPGIFPFDPKAVQRAAGWLLAALAAATFYNLIAGPWLIHCINGYFPSFAYQQNSPPPVIYTVRHGLWYIAVNFGHCFSGTGCRPVNTVIGAAALLVCIHRLAHKRPAAAAGFCVIIAAMWICATMMITRHIEMLNGGTLYGNYFITFLVLLWYLLAATVSTLRGKYAGMLCAALLALTILGCATELLPARRREIPSGEDQSRERQQTESIIYAIKHSGQDIRTMPLPERSRNFIRRMREIYRR